MIANVVLFDVDGTLISNLVATGDERRRFLKSIYEVVGLEPSVAPSRFAGMVDPQICKILLTEAGLDDEKVTYFLPKVLSRMGEVYRDMKKKPLLNEGVRELLQILAKSRNHILGVLTGNLSAVTMEKLKVTGIDSYFTEHFSADDYFDRNHLVEDAVKTCAAKHNLSSRKNVVIIGDTPNDINAANAARATSIGIASGVFSLEQLSQSHPTFVFPDFKPSEELLKALGL